MRSIAGIINLQDKKYKCPNRNFKSMQERPIWQKKIFSTLSTSYCSLGILHIPQMLIHSLNYFLYIKMSMSNYVCEKYSKDIEYFYSSFISKLAPHTSLHCVILLSNDLAARLQLK